jgi:hypothetical protein
MKTIGLQLSSINDIELQKQSAACKNLSIDPIYFGLIPFSDTIASVEDFKNYDLVACFGATKLVHLITNNLAPLNAKIWYNHERFDQAFYRSILKNELLNYDSVITTLDLIKDVPISKSSFIKPTSDLKAFPGSIVPADKTPGEIIFEMGHRSSNLSDTEQVLIAPLKKIIKEHRCFVINKTIVSSSRYYLNSSLSPAKTTPEELKALSEKLNEISKLYDPSEAYVVDFATLADESIKVVEYNCINCSGSYFADLEPVYEGVLKLT